MAEQARRLSIVLTNNPVADANLGHFATLTGSVQSVSLSSEAQGGFASAQLVLTLSRVEAFRLLTGAVGKRLVVYSAQSPKGIAWEGMVQTVAVEEGANPVTRTMADCHNRIEVVYATVDTSTTPPTVGIQARTAQADNSTSQASFGIRHLVYAIGGSNSTNATALRDALLTQYGLPRAAAVSLGMGLNGDFDGGVTVTVDAVGFVESLDKRIWRTTATTATATLDTIIKAILTGVGQFVSSDQTQITANTYTRSQYFDQDLTARRTIDLLCALGDGATTRRRYFGIYENRVPYYTVEPVSPDYIVTRRNANETIREASTGRPVMPWDVRPGKVVKVADVIPEGVQYSTVNEDVRTFVIGSTRWESPGKLILTPITKDAAQLTLARIGLTEIG